MPEFDYQEGDIIRAGHGYKVLKQLGSGGMSGCYLGEHRKMYRRCAIKVLHSRLWNRPDLIEMFEYEGRTIARLGQPAPHEGIIEILDLGRTSDRGEMPYLVMPYLFGETLDGALRRVGRFSVLSAIGMATRLLLALQYAHERGVIHRDVKPQNIFLVQPQLRSVVADESSTSGIAVKLLDWGIMKLVSSVDDRGVFIGTPAWASPEQIAGEGVGTASDLYSAGVVLFETLTGQRPFASHGNDRGSLLRARSGPAPLLRDFGSFPGALEELVARLLSPDPVGRPPDARSVVLELQAIASDTRAHADHATDVVVFRRPADTEQIPEPITHGLIAAPTIEDPDVPRRVLEEAMRLAQEQAEEEARAEARDGRPAVSGFESTMNQDARRNRPPHVERVEPAVERAEPAVDPSAARRDAPTNLPARSSPVSGPALSIRYASDVGAMAVLKRTLPLSTKGAPHRTARQMTEPMAERPLASRPPPAMPMAVAPSAHGRSDGGLRRWVGRLARRPVSTDVAAVALAGIAAAGFGLGGLRVLGAWPKVTTPTAAPAPSATAHAPAPSATAHAPAPLAEGAPPAVATRAPTLPRTDGLAPSAAPAADASFVATAGRGADRFEAAPSAQTAPSADPGLAIGAAPGGPSAKEAAAAAVIPVEAPAPLARSAGRTRLSPTPKRPERPAPATARGDGGLASHGYMVDLE